MFSLILGEECIFRKVSLCNKNNKGAPELTFFQISLKQQEKQICKGDKVGATDRDRNTYKGAMGAVVTGWGFIKTCVSQRVTVNEHLLTLIVFHFLSNPCQIQSAPTLANWEQ